MAKNESKKARYAFTRAFECAIALAEVTTPRFHAVLGHAIDPERMPTADAGLLFQAAQQVALRTGAGCTSPLIALQAIRRLVDEGKITYEQMQQASDLVDLAEDVGGTGDIDALIEEAIPIVGRVAQQEALEVAIKDFGQGNGAASAAESFEKVAGLGKRRISVGSMIDGSEADILAVAAPTVRDPLTTGIGDLDMLLDGGLERPAMGLVLGGTGDGKSIALKHFAAEAIFSGIDVAYMTLELNEAQIKQGIYSNLFGMTAEEMAKDPARAAARFEQLKEREIGKLVVCFATPKATTPAHIKSWLREVEQERKFSPKLVVIDYIDKLAGNRSKSKLHEELDDVAQQLRDIITERDGWLWTASQTNRQAVRKKRVDVGDGANSMGPVRIADVVLAIVRTDDDCEEGTIRFRLPKRRNGPAHGEIGPLPMDAVHHRLVTISRDVAWERAKKAARGLQEMQTEDDPKEEEIF